MNLDSAIGQKKLYQQVLIIQLGVQHKQIRKLNNFIDMIGPSGPIV